MTTTEPLGNETEIARKLALGGRFDGGGRPMKSEAAIDRCPTAAVIDAIRRDPTADASPAAVSAALLELYAENDIRVAIAELAEDWSQAVKAYNWLAEINAAVDWMTEHSS